ncbi:MAG: sigma-70 family RNA polymerase sigma factor [Pirellulaceae bacterium]|nr:sigma-70 family RNA polymerase sigma factor [Pirellulaceae bacterium]
MQKRDSPDDGRRENDDQTNDVDRSDEAIERLLASDCERAQRTGVIYLDTEKRKYIFRILRAISRNFSSEDLADLYQETLLEIWKNAAAGKYEARGRLNAYICCIAAHTAIDEIRRRCAVRRAAVMKDFDSEMSSDRRRPCTTGRTFEDFRTFVLSAFDRASEMAGLTDRHHHVMRIFIELLLEYNRKPSTAELTEAVNATKWRTGNDPMSKSAVKSALRDARRKLRSQLEKEIDGDE